MQLNLSDIIRKFRRQRNMTQEQLAETLGVTVGAVHKWESGLSVPELNTLVEIADFFDTSVDVLLGYTMINNSIDSVLGRMSEYCKSFDPMALDEAEKALGKYPNSLKVVHSCAMVYLVFGAGNHDKGQLRRSLELYERAKLLLNQSDDRNISEITISGGMASILFLLDEREKSLELMKNNNCGGIFNGNIGAFLAVYMNRPEEAEPYLAESLASSITEVFQNVISYAFVYLKRKEWDSAREIVMWGIRLIEDIKTESKPDYLEKMHAELLSVLAIVQKMSGLTDESNESLKKAYELAREFDSKPDFSLETFKFTDKGDQLLSFDILGSSALGSVEQILNIADCQSIRDCWKELCENGQ
ncbi:MAG: helix-turn-helix domain-containing protein [Clostridiales bacterium]|nr:helix-turn-helix domain-containing protein [Clostridiales bacterium]